MMFVIHLVTIHAALILAGGFVLFHFAKKQHSRYLRVAAWILVSAAVFTLGCNSYYGYKYWKEGRFEKPWCSETLANK